MSNSGAKCWCHNCQRDIHYMGIATHRAMHKRRKERVEITMVYGHLDLRLLRSIERYLRRLEMAYGIQLTRKQREMVEEFMPKKMSRVA